MKYELIDYIFTVKKPTSVSYVEAAGCIGDAVKAYTALHYLGRMCSGETGLSIIYSIIEEEILKTRTIKYSNK